MPFCWAREMLLLAKKLLLTATWCGAIWVLWAPRTFFGGFSVGHDGKTEYVGFAGWYYIRVGRSRPYSEGFLLDGILLGVGATILVTGFVLLCDRRFVKSRI